MGRKLSTTEAVAALNMLPKLLDVPIRTYLMVFAKIRRPSMTPSASTPRSLSSSTTSAASLATSVALSTEMPMSAACSARASLTPSPMNPTAPPLCRSSRMIRAFCSGETRAKMLASRAAAASSGSDMASTAAPVSVPPESTPSSSQTFSATLALSPVAILTVMPSASSWSSEAAGVGFGPVQEDEEPGRTRSSLVGWRSGPARPPAGRVPTATTRDPASNCLSSIACTSAGVPTQSARTSSGRAFGDDAGRSVRRRATSTLVLRRWWSKSMTSRRS